MPPELELSRNLVKSIHSVNSVEGLTHNLYPYPARFSPIFAKAVIEEFSEPGDVVLDPFVGGGTTLVEAYTANRYSIGFDINPVAVLVSKTKTSTLTNKEIEEIKKWAKSIIPNINLHRKIPKTYKWKELGYTRNLPWTVEKFMYLVIEEIHKIRDSNVELVLRCALLKFGNKVLNQKSGIPSAGQLREIFEAVVEELLFACSSLSNKVGNQHKYQPEVILGSIGNIADKKNPWKEGKKPNLVITSPPYPGVHVLYHRWQVQSRRETPALYWVANQLDGKSEAYYTLGGRSEGAEDYYFEQITNHFQDVANNISEEALVVQLIGFSDPKNQFGRYMQAMENAGLENQMLKVGRNKKNYIAREVPSRKWFADIQGEIPTSTEYFIVHKRM